MRTSRPVWAVTVAVAALALSACGDDDDDAADDTVPATAPSTEAEATTTPTSSAPSTTAGATTTTSAETGTDTAEDTAEDTTEAASEEFCTTVVEAEQVATTGPDVDFEAATEEEITAAMEEFSAALVPLLDDLAETVPDEIAGDLETIDSALRESMETGDDPSSQPGFVEADRAIDGYVADNCGFDVYTVRAVEYAFEDVPPTIEAGTVGFDLQNEGREVHELVLFRINDDVDLTIEELLELPEDESESMVEFITAAFAAPGESDMTFQDLRPGRYGILCFVPVGTTDMSMLEEEPEGEATGDATDGATTTEATGETTGTADEGTTGDAGELGPPHFTQGMVAEFEVTEAGSGGSSATTTTDNSDSSATTTTDNSDASAPSTTDDSDSSATTTTGG